jgi:hypothetical protein
VQTQIFQWLNSFRAEKEKAQEVHSHQRGKSGIAGNTADAAASQKPKAAS